MPRKNGWRNGSLREMAMIRRTHILVNYMICLPHLRIATTEVTIGGK